MTFTRISGKRFEERLHSLGNPCLNMTLSADAWIPLKYLHHYSCLVWELGMLYCCWLQLIGQNLKTDHMTRILPSDWSISVTWPGYGYWPLIGRSIITHIMPCLEIIRNARFLKMHEETFLHVCKHLQENTFRVLKQSFNSDLITRFCKRPCVPGKPGPHFNF